MARSRYRNPAVARDWGRQVNRTWLTLRVHADAFRLDPLAYLQATAWRLRGLRVRSRNRIAALAGRSPHAYALWIARNELPALFGGDSSGTMGVAILPVIDCRGGGGGTLETIASITASGSVLQPITIGGPVVAGAMNLGHPRDLARLAGAEGMWLCPLLPGDRLAPNALADYSAVAAASDTRVVYADDDVIVDDRRSTPHFKPRWNPDLFEHHDFVTGASIIFAVRETLSSAPEEGWVPKLVADALRLGSLPLHLPLVLHHRGSRPAPRLPSTPAEPVGDLAPLVSVIVPTRNQLGLLRSCIDGLGRASYPSVETIIVDNGSDDDAVLHYLRALEADGFRVMRRPGAFNFSRLNNAAVQEATGELLCFLNNDVEMIDPDWLSLLVRQALRPEIGAVGARLLYPDHTVQHAGVFTGIGGGAGHGHRFQHADDSGYFERARLPQQISAVTAACMVVARDKFVAVNGFDEQEFPVAFNDVDLCLKLNARGWQSFYEPRATLIHHESKSRGNDSAKPSRARFAAELAALKRKWRTDTDRDPYHHPHLSPFCEQFLVSV